MRLLQCPKAFFLVITLLAAPVAVAQSFQIQPVGGDDTFNVATWNIEHFGTSGPSSGNTERQFENVLSVMQQANVHLWALQEMQTRFSFDRLVAALGEGWAGVWQPDLTSHSIGYGFIYRSDLVQPTRVRTILTDHAYDFAYRPPLEMRANLTLPGGSISTVYFINLHAKANTGSTEDRRESYHRRERASIALKGYVDNLVFINARVLVLGDLNDRILVSTFNSWTSPYDNFYRDAANYHFGSLSLEQANVPTWCSNASCTSGSTIDHVLITRPLFGDYVENSTARYDDMVTQIPSYRSSTSDHVAVYSLFDFFPTTSGEGGSDPIEFALQSPFPNPFSAHTTVTFSLPEMAQVRVEVFDALGRRVATIDQGARAAGTHEVGLRGTNLTAGMYLVRLTASTASGERTATRRVIRLP
jgi:exonuclease III